jgi:hypothetical protein
MHRGNDGHRFIIADRPGSTRGSKLGQLGLRNPISSGVRGAVESSVPARKAAE